VCLAFLLRNDVIVDHVKFLTFRIHSHAKKTLTSSTKLIVILLQGCFSILIVVDYRNPGMHIYTTIDGEYVIHGL